LSRPCLVLDHRPSGGAGGVTGQPEPPWTVTGPVTQTRIPAAGTQSLGACPFRGGRIPTSPPMTDPTAPWLVPLHTSAPIVFPRDPSRLHRDARASTLRPDCPAR